MQTSQMDPPLRVIRRTQDFRPPLHLHYLVLPFRRPIPMLSLVLLLQVTKTNDSNLKSKLLMHNGVFIESWVEGISKYLDLHGCLHRSALVHRYFPWNHLSLPTSHAPLFSSFASLQSSFG
jgi:hypothetical protein